MDDQLDKLEKTVAWINKIAVPALVILLIAGCVAYWMIALGNS